MDEKFINRFKSYSKSLDSLSEAKNRDLSDDFVMSGTVQKFSLTFDISWKILKELLVNYYGILDFATGSPRETIKKAASCDLIHDDLWINMMNDRNLLAHDYDGEIARSRVSIIINDYLPLFAQLRDKINNEFINNNSDISK